MKRIAIILLFLAACIPTFAQVKHMTFMGIPIDGTIDQFQRKLAEKGVYRNYELSKKVGEGARVFNLRVEGCEYILIANYNKEDKIVEMLQIDGAIEDKGTLVDFCITQAYKDGYKLSSVPMSSPKYKFSFIIHDKDSDDVGSIFSYLEDRDFRVVYMDTYNEYTRHQGEE